MAKGPWKVKPGMTHGKASSYSWGKCRCEACTKANAARIKLYRNKKAKAKKDA